MNYTQAVQYVDSLQLHKIKLGLEPLRDFLKKVGDPQKSLRCIHVAGTNGKGSVCAAGSSIFRQAGYSTAIYSSPHLSDIRERFCIDGVYISKDDFARYVTRIHEVLGEDRITYFECTTAIAFLWFAEKNPDLVFLETGMGGRLDATSVVDPLICVITNVSKDHEAYLGRTVSEIAGEKAGIIRPHVPVLSGCAGKAQEVVEKKCQETGNPLYVLGTDFKCNGSTVRFSWNAKVNLTKESVGGLSTSLRGQHQLDNIALVLGMVPLLGEEGFFINDDQIRAGLADVRWPGRSELCETENSYTGHVQPVLLDGGHNPAGIEMLVGLLEQEFVEKEIVLVWAAMKDKDCTATLPLIAPLAKKIILTRAESERAADPEDMLRDLDTVYHNKCIIEQNAESSLSSAFSFCDEETLIVVAGSLYLVGEVRRKLVGELV